MNDGLEREHAAAKGEDWGDGGDGMLNLEWRNLRRRWPHKGPDGLQGGKLSRYGGVLLGGTWE